MIFLISMTIAVLFILLCGESLRKQPVPYYIAAMLLAVAVIILTWRNISLPNAVAAWLWPVFSRGGIGGALFVIVMITGAFPNGSKPIKRLLPIRGRLSILASILTLGHNVSYGKTYFVRLFTRPDELPLYQLLAAVCSVIMIVIMLPLFVTSFMTVRKKMNAGNWKRLQRSAYLFYGLLCCHILLLTVPGALIGHSGYRLTVFVYSAVFVSYVACRILKAYSVKKKDVRGLLRKQKISVINGCAIAFTFVFLLPANSVSYPESPAEKTKEWWVQNAENKDGLSIYRDGVFSGSGMGMNAEITVSVTVESDVIVDIQIDSAREDEPYFSDAKAVIEEILRTNSVDVDTVSGATYSSGGIMDAVADALEKAGN